MRLTPTDLIDLYRPSECGLRVYLRHRGEPEGESSPYVAVLAQLGKVHEQAHLSTFDSYLDLSAGNEDERIARTCDAVRNHSPVIYQGVLAANAKLNNVDISIVGVPDFLICAGDGYIVRDSKISRRVNLHDHPEIIFQIQLYGWLFEQTFKTPATALEVHSGAGIVVPVADDRGVEALKALGCVLDTKRSASAPYAAVGWTKCGGCSFSSSCWKRAEAQHDVALVVGVDQSLATALHEIGVNTRAELLERFDNTALSEFKRPWGDRSQKVGKKAESILLMAKVMEDNKEVVLQPPSIPDHPNYVMFDLEGLPPQSDDLEKVYLWGMQVFGEKEGPFLGATAGFGVDGDREGWQHFLDNSQRVFNENGDLPFVHWHHYERVRLDMYVQRFGDPDGIAARVRTNLLDLLPIAQRSVALPLPSYSLKVVEKYIGFTRIQEEYGGDWAMAKYIEATEIQNSDKRSQLMQAILDYNREDLKATWAVLQWLKARKQ